MGLRANSVSSQPDAYLQEFAVVLPCFARAFAIFMHFSNEFVINPNPHALQWTSALYRLATAEHQAKVGGEQLRLLA